MLYKQLNQVKIHHIASNKVTSSQEHFTGFYSRALAHNQSYVLVVSLAKSEGYLV